MSSRHHDDHENVVTDSSGDVFRDLGIELSREDEIKVAIAIQITDVINRAGLTQKEIARLLRTDQAKVSAITRGQLSGFSVRRLFRFLLDLGFDVDVRISRHESGRRGQLRVTREGVAGDMNQLTEAVG